MAIISRRGILGAGLALPALARAQGDAPITIGEINSYTTIPAFTLPYRSGWQLAVEHINEAGGVLGRRLAVISRDDAGKPQDAVRLANEFLDDAKVDLLAGTFLSHVALAVSDVALQRKRLFVAAEPLADAMVWEKGHPYCFRLRCSTYMQASMLVEEAAKLPAKRWAIIAPNYEYGQSAVAWFKTLLQARRPDVEFIAEQWPALGRIDAGASVQALAQARPEAIFNVTFSTDLTSFVRQGNTRGLFEGRPVVSMLTGEPEYLDALGEETPEGWFVTGYPWQDINTPEHVAFRDAYRARFNDYPRLGSVIGYATFMSIAAGIARAGSLDVDRLIAGFRGADFMTPFGRAYYRPIDHQSTFGACVGRTALRDGKGVMVDWRYEDGARHLPDDAAVRRLRREA